MARRRPNDEDPRVTDLRRYRKMREQAQRRPQHQQRRGGESFLGSNPRAAIILAIVIVVLIALYVIPRFL
jgi:hypothetical protein